MAKVKDKLEVFQQYVNLGKEIEGCDNVLKSYQVIQDALGGYLDSMLSKPIKALIKDEKARLMLERDLLEI